MRFGFAAAVLCLLLAGCGGNTTSVSFDTTQGVLPANTVPEAYKAGVAQQVHDMNWDAFVPLGGGLNDTRPEVRTLAIGKPYAALIPGTTYVQVALRTKALASVEIGGMAPPKCYEVGFNDSLGQVSIAMREIKDDPLACSSGMEDMLAYYQAKYPG